jgi:predicted  nucleic acid-binding Zn-ribbon protein
MAKILRRTKDKIALGKAAQANSIIESLKDVEIGGLAISVSNLNTNLTIIKESLENADIEILDALDTLETEIESLSTQINNLETVVTNLSNNATTLGNEIISLADRVTALESV